MATLQKHSLRKTIIVSVICIIILAIAGLGLSDCIGEEAHEGNGNFAFSPLLSAYHIFSGKPADMVAGKGFHAYQLATTLFTDYSHKQRLIWLPKGTKMIKTDANLPEFPDSTVLVKTFFYYNDERDTSKGKRMIETRLMIKSKGIWHMGTFVWNTAQTEATYQKAGSSTAVEWISQAGEKKEITYQVPNVRQCGKCHRSGREIVPIGPKIRNMNFDVGNNGTTANQLAYFQSIGMLSSFDPHKVDSLPQAFNPRFTIAEQARAYMEMNCAHCHNPKGYCSDTRLYLQYALPMEQTNILKDKNRIISKTANGRMPLLGKTMIHKEGIALIKAYIEGLK
jgi:uncharacterized repeat protein (TIGR03806 family)